MTFGDIDGRELAVSEWPLSRALKGEKVQGLELRVRTKNSESEFFLTSNAIPVLDAQGKVQMVVLTAEDTTLRRRAEEALIRSEKLAVTGRLAATVAHEVNNPLAGALNAVYVASTVPAQAPQMLALADQELRRAAHIVQQTLGFYRGNGSRELIAATTAIDEILDIYAGRLRNRNISVRRHYDCMCRDGCQGCFLINTVEFRQIVSNLLANGIDALSDGGVLQVRLSRTSNPQTGEPRVQLTMADNGCGIRDEDLKNIFEPFFTTKKEVGTGLGLWVTQELIRKHNGNIKVRSSKDKGTAFRVSFPAMPLPLSRSDSSSKSVNI